MTNELAYTSALLVTMTFITWFAANVLITRAISRRRWVQPEQHNGRKEIYSSKLSVLRMAVFSFPLLAFGVIGTIAKPYLGTALVVLLVFSFIFYLIINTWQFTGRNFSVSWNARVVEGPSTFRSFRPPVRRELRIDRLRGVGWSGNKIQLQDESHNLIEFDVSWEGHNHLLRDIFRNRPELFDRYKEKRWFKELTVGL